MKLFKSKKDKVQKFKVGDKVQVIPKTVGIADPDEPLEFDVTYTVSKVTDTPQLDYLDQIIAVEEVPQFMYHATTFKKI